MANKKSKGLGRGLNELFADNGVNTDEETVVDLDLNVLRPNPYQPRQTFNEDALVDLANSIEKSGVFQPIIVREAPDQAGHYEILAGERRVRASKRADQSQIPAIVRQVTEEQMMEIGVLENLQREDLTPLEEAEAYDMLMTNLQLTQAQVSERLGKSRPYIANYLRLLGLPKAVKDMLQDNQLSMGQARTLLSLKDKSKLGALAKKAAEEKMTVRALEAEVNRLNGKAKKSVKKPLKRKKSPFVRSTENQLQERFGTQVSINETAGKDHKGKIEIDFMSNDDLNRILELLKINQD
ncbi:ParB/RepB/Spo0J family partition protein [Levilactobacillus bambusae]|uniref:Chromosome partitioning protein ParB n=1 Tax=Levilactobacillus bambusae TaxID=2024736 RepID=A0A2V1N000_9LACO|nr:ParB/RepB/Spo0J family partition protein [Levilactobacillus bambusae]PWF99744.1 chromosome partitioning protein ParB [Levilactobacillus bambusae]